VEASDARAGNARQFRRQRPWFAVQAVITAVLQPAEVVGFAWGFGVAAALLLTVAVLSFFQRVGLEANRMV